MPADEDATRVAVVSTVTGVAGAVKSMVCVPLFTSSVKFAVLMAPPDVTLTAIVRGLLSAFVGVPVSAPLLSKARPRSDRAVTGSLA